MPSLNTLTWNSTGETAQGAADLQDVIQYLTANNWPPHVIVIQEANAAPGGAIYNVLNGLGAAYNHPPAHAIEGGTAGRGYLLTTHATVDGNGTFRRYDLGADPMLLQWINSELSLRARQIATDELTTMRMPATAYLTFQGRMVPFLTWHAPRGPGQVLAGATLGGGANPDAYLFLQNSFGYMELTGPGMNGLGLIAGDLNITVEQLNTPTGWPAMPRILPDWIGVSDNLDHILGHPQAGQPNPTFQNSGNFPASGTHRILVSTVTWQ